MRDLSSNGTKWPGVTIPHTIPALDEDSMAAAMRALCEGCDIDPDNIFIPQCISPITFYKMKQDSAAEFQKNVAHEIVTVYLAVTNDPPPDGGEDDNFQD